MTWPSGRSIRTRLQQGDAAGFSAEGDDVLVGWPDHPAHVIVAGGKPLREPVVFYGPFCMNSRRH